MLAHHIHPNTRKIPAETDRRKLIDNCRDAGTASVTFGEGIFAEFRGHVLTRNL